MSNFTPQVIQIGLHLQQLKKRWLSIALFTIIFTLIATYYIFSKPSIYQSTATLLIQQEQNNAALSIEEIYGVDATKKEYFQTQVAILNSNYIAHKVILTQGLDTDPEFISQGGLKALLEKAKTWPELQTLLNLTPTPKGTSEYPAVYYRALENFKNRLTIEPVRNTQLVRIKFESTDPQKATMIANAIGQAYIESNFEAKLAITQNATNWLTTNAQKLEERLQQSEQALQEFLLKEGLIDINGIDEIYANELDNLTQRLSEARNRRIESQTLIELLQRKSSQNLDSLLSIDEFSNQAQIRDLKNAEIQAEKMVSELSQRYGPKHDKMKQANAQLVTIRQRSTQLIRDIARSKQQDLRSAKIQENKIRTELNNKKDEFQLLGSQKARYDQLKREVDSNRQLYEVFLNREKETNATSDYRNVNARFTDAAMVPLFPIAPQRIKLVLLAGVAGLLIASMIVVIFETMRQVISGPRDVEEKLGMSCIGILPKVKQTQKGMSGITYHAYLDPDNRVFSESCRSVRTSLLLKLTNQDQKILAFTSAIPSEGKTTTCINIATAFSNLERVLLIDCDLRKPKLRERFDIPKQVPGLSNVLTMGVPIDDALIRIDDANLDVLCAGLISPNPQELLSSARFNQLLELLKRRYDRIIIDTPPLLSVSDALIIGKYAEGLITVVKADTTKVSLVNLALSKQFQHAIPSFGVLISQSKIKHGDAKYVENYAY